MQSHNASESIPSVHVKAYLSYRQNNPHNPLALELLKQHCDGQSIDLVYDQEALHSGDSIKRFMDELGSARCIFIFLTPNYFESAYTLYELVTIDQWAELDRRFIHPIRITDDMDASQWTTLQNHWRDNEATRDALANLLGRIDHESAWQQIEKAWKNIVGPYLDKIHASLQQSDPNTAMSELIASAWTSIRLAIDEEQTLLHQKITQEITEILKNNFVPMDKLAREMGLPPGITAESVAKRWLDDNEIESAIAVITRTLQENRKKIELPSPQQWEDYHHQATQIGGWLLLKSIDSNWWFNHQLKMKQLAKKSINRTYSLTYPPYVEVIVSRSLLKPARFQLDTEGNAQPMNHNHNLMLFDGVSAEATEIQLLGPLCKDLHKSEQYPAESKKLLDGIYARAKSHFKVNQKPIYYLMANETLQLFERQPWYLEMSQRLAEYIQFICFNQQQSSDNSSPCEDPRSLLDQYATLLSLLRQ